ncbi:MAG: hypothetical protein IPL78_11140 [Chloroflexi bacterium]|nr:hypothetical protein [Chloroflexota bacterium]
MKRLALITDPTEQSLVNQGIIPADQTSLVAQDKTFVPEMDQPRCTRPHLGPQPLG